MDSNGLLLTDKSVVTYNCSIEGNIGRFKTSAGEVFFLQTRARLADREVSSAARLTSLLTPAREALDVKKMDFNQLLQRDLDDHRIAHELVPYILKPQDTGPAFFPPILAALLPFENLLPKEELPPKEKFFQQSDPNFANSTWNISKVGNVFSLQELCYPDGKVDPKGTAILKWNDELAKLVIMDGQHRAMALLAIYRTVNNAWRSSGAASERYSTFYEVKINKILRELKDNNQESVVGTLEFPVTICMFPEYVGPGRNPHQAARKLFVDVNKEAKPPSESRLILLSDTRLDHILAREILNRLRSDNESNNMPLYAVEYDNPNSKRSTPRRWNAITNLEIILRAIDYCCFGPEDIVSEINKLTRVIGQPNKIAKSSYFRTQMRLQDFLSSTFEDGPRSLDRQKIGIDYFPIYNHEARKALLDKFYLSWGNGLVKLFSDIEPYKAHVKAVKEVLQGWLGGSVSGDLAKEALFEGVGMFWTLEEGYKHWKEQVRKSEDDSIPAETEVCHAWKIVDEVKRKEFEKLRCRNYLGRGDDKSVFALNNFYSQTITYAAQVGLALTWAMLRKHNPEVDSNKILDSMIVAINRSLTSGPVSSRDRKLIFSKEEKNPLNLLTKLDAPFAAYFRVFWLELIMVKDNHETLINAGVDIDSLGDFLRKGRRFYANKIVEQNLPLYKDDGLTKSQVLKMAQERTTKDLARAYKHWFGFSEKNAQDMFDELLESDDDLEYDSGGSEYEDDEISI